MGRALQEVMEGSVVLPKGYQPPAEVSPSSDLAARIATLTPQQVRVLQMLRQGSSREQIMAQLRKNAPRQHPNLPSFLAGPYENLQRTIMASALPVTPSQGLLLMAGAFVFQRARGIDPWRSGLGPVILLNLALPFIFTNLNISIGGHIGGLVGGAIAAIAIERLGATRRGDLLPVLACVAVGVVAVVGAIVVSSNDAAQFGF